MSDNMRNTKTLNAETISPNTEILVAITTCSRPDSIRSHLAQLIQCVNDVDGADLIVAVDGLSEQGNQQSLDFALPMGVNCVVSDHSEGVGISKNRVVALLGGYDYYFFLDDDVEVLSSRLFSEHVDLHLETSIHHFSLHHPERLLDEVSSTATANGGVIRHAMYGGAAVSFFTRKALQCVGGWHPSFAKIRRGGHTEHSYRIYRAQLCPAPFNLFDSLVGTCSWNDPPSVVNAGRTGYKVGENRLFELENELIAEKITSMPFSASSIGRLVNP